MSNDGNVFLSLVGNILEVIRNEDEEYQRTTSNGKGTMNEIVIEDDNFDSFGWWSHGNDHIMDYTELSSNEHHLPNINNDGKQIDYFQNQWYSLMDDAWAIIEKGLKET